MIRIRPEKTQDIGQIHEVNIDAFGQAAEAMIVDKLRERCGEFLSLVAEDEDSIVGHIMFSPVTIETNGKSLRGMGLAPMAVRPGCQRQGIGSRMILQGLKLLRQRDCPFVIVLGHSGYYPRFGFEPASRYGIACQWPGIPDEAFMVLELVPNALSNINGIARYRDEFDEIM